jgi:hypothetical protein
MKLTGTWVTGYGVGSSVSGQGQVEGYCEYVTEHRRICVWGNFLTSLENMSPD